MITKMMMMIIKIFKVDTRFGGDVRVGGERVGKILKCRLSFKMVVVLFYCTYKLSQVLGSKVTNIVVLYVLQ